MDMNQIANILTQKLQLNNEQQGTLTQSIEKAKSILNSVNNPVDALRKENITPEFLQKIKGYINNPFYGFLLPMLGIDKNVALQKIDSLEKMLSNDGVNSNVNYTNQPVQRNQSDDLDIFRRGLKNIK